MFLPVAAQQAKKAVPEVKDSIPFFRGVAVSTDLVGPAQLLFGSYGQYEAALRINFKDKYFPVFEGGVGKSDAFEVTTSTAYRTTAPYGRIGLDFNVMKNKHDVYRLYAGARYGFTAFKYSVEREELTDPVWQTAETFHIDNAKGTFHWVELVFGVDAKIWGPLRMGWTARYKRRIAHNRNGMGDPWYVPGFGLYGGTRLGGTFNITLEW